MGRFTAAVCSIFLRRRRFAERPACDEVGSSIGQLQFVSVG